MILKQEPGVRSQRSSGVAERSFGKTRSEDPEGKSGVPFCNS
jgi:hypothetical protein